MYTLLPPTIPGWCICAPQAIPGWCICAPQAIPGWYMYTPCYTRVGYVHSVLYPGGYAVSVPWWVCRVGTMVGMPCRYHGGYEGIPAMYPGGYEGIPAMYPGGYREVYTTLPTMPGTPPWVYHRPTMLTTGTMVSTLAGTLPDDDALGSILRIPLGERPFYASLPSFL